MTDTAATTPTMTAAPEVRTRFPPSPTGSLHVGGARTALFNWLFAYGQARREGKEGGFTLRIEDTDRARYVPGATEGIINILRWFGLDWDEGPDIDGPRGPYVQSERTAIYQKHADRLLDQGHAYRCFCARERLEQLREEQQARGVPPGYDRRCRNLDPATIEANLAAGVPAVVRFKMPRSGETRFTDLIRGEIVYQNENIEDLVLLKSDGYPTYHLANVVDDHLMGVTHIMRGDEWIPTAPLHFQLYLAFGWEVPTLAHMPLILGSDRKKLSKRHGAVAMEQFRDDGFLPEALMNYLALLGWSLDATTEFFSKEDLLAKFTLARVSPSPAKFDHEKLRWFNQHYINHILTLDDLVGRVIPFLADAGLVEPGAVDPSHPQHRQVKDATALLKDRLETLAEAPDLMRYFLKDELDPYDAALLIPKKLELMGVVDALVAVEQALDEVDLDDEAATEARLRALAEELGLKAGQLFMPIRVAVTGRTQSPGLFETMRVVGKDRCRARLTAAIDLLRGHGDETLTADG